MCISQYLAMLEMRVVLATSSNTSISHSRQVLLSPLLLPLYLHSFPFLLIVPFLLILQFSSFSFYFSFPFSFPFPFPFPFPSPFPFPFPFPFFPFPFPYFLFLPLPFLYFLLKLQEYCNTLCSHFFRALFFVPFFRDLFYHLPILFQGTSQSQNSES
jgi:hypothetical protein